MGHQRQEGADLVGRILVKAILCALLLARFQVVQVALARQPNPFAGDDLFCDNGFRILKRDADIIG